MTSANKITNKEEFLEQLNASYTSDSHKAWIVSLRDAINKVDPYLENNFYSNHFSDLSFENGSINPASYFKFHQGLWHLHMANFASRLGQLEKPQTEDDIVISEGFMKIHIECICLSWGREESYIRNVYREMTQGFTSIDKIHENFIEKLHYAIEKKEEQVRKRQDSQKRVNFLAVNEGLMVNGFKEWAGKGITERFKEAVQCIPKNSVFTGMFYASVGEGGYCSLGSENNILFKGFSCDNDAHSF